MTKTRMPTCRFWRASSAAGKHQHQVVGGHGHALAQVQSVRVRNSLHVFAPTQAVGGVVGAQAGVKGAVAFRWWARGLQVGRR